MTVIPGKTACLRCLYRGPVPESKFSVIGVTPAVIGSIQAAEVIKYLVGIGDLLANRLLAFDGLNLKFTEFKVQRNPQCEHCAHI
jgi:adenylyltransferase/sulfurtransferase